jgi:hypothetical protein
MRTTMKRRIAAGVSAFAISATGFALAGATTAEAAPADATGATQGTHAIPAAATPGTYEIYFNTGSGFFDAGQLYLNSNNSWSMSEYLDGGTWETVGATLGMSDYDAGYADDAAAGAKVSGTNLGSASKPGLLLGAGAGSLTWYAHFISAGVRQGAQSSSRHALTGAVRPAAGHATFPGTYNTVIGGVGGYQTVYNSDKSWSMPGFCNAGTYISFKVTKGTTVTYTDIQADQGCTNDHLWMAKEHGASKIGTASKQGIIAESSLGGVYNHFYSVLAS